MAHLPKIYKWYVTRRWHPLPKRIVYYTKVAHLPDRESVPAWQRWCEDFKSEIRKVRNLGGGVSCRPFLQIFGFKTVEN